MYRVRAACSVLWSADIGKVFNSLIFQSLALISVPDYISYAVLLLRVVSPFNLLWIEGISTIDTIEILHYCRKIHFGI